VARMFYDVASSEVAPPLFHCISLPLSSSVLVCAQFALDIESCLFLTLLHSDQSQITE